MHRTVIDSNNFFQNGFEVFSNQKKSNDTYRPFNTFSSCNTLNCTDPKICSKSCGKLDNVYTVSNSLTNFTVSSGLKASTDKKNKKFEKYKYEESVSSTNSIESKGSNKNNSIDKLDVKLQNSEAPKQYDNNLFMIIKDKDYKIQKNQNFDSKNNLVITDDSSCETQATTDFYNIYQSFFSNRNDKPNNQCHSNNQLSKNEVANEALPNKIMSTTNVLIENSTNISFLDNKEKKKPSISDQKQLKCQTEEFNLSQKKPLVTTPTKYNTPETSYAQIKTRIFSNDNSNDITNTTPSTTSTIDNTATVHSQKMKPMKLQFYRTKICPWVITFGRCRRGSGCRYAHSIEELRPLPDLSKTKMCDDVIKNGKCSNIFRCNYAHSYDELRATQSFSKTKLCPDWKEGKCVAGSVCRFAHGEQELRNDNIIQVTKTDTISSAYNKQNGTQKETFNNSRSPSFHSIYSSNAPITPWTLSPVPLKNVDVSTEHLDIHQQNSRPVSPVINFDAPFVYFSSQYPWATPIKDKIIFQNLPSNRNYAEKQQWQDDPSLYSQILASGDNDRAQILTHLLPSEMFTPITRKALPQTQSDKTAFDTSPCNWVSSEQKCYEQQLTKTPQSAKNTSISQAFYTTALPVYAHQQLLRTPHIISPHHTQGQNLMYPATNFNNPVQTLAANTTKISPIKSPVHSQNIILSPNNSMQFRSSRVVDHSLFSPPINQTHSWTATEARYSEQQLTRLPFIQAPNTREQQQTVMKNPLLVLQNPGLQLDKNASVCNNPSELSTLNDSNGSTKIATQSAICNYHSPSTNRTNNLQTKANTLFSQTSMIDKPMIEQQKINYTSTDDQKTIQIFDKLSVCQSKLINYVPTLESTIDTKINFDERNKDLVTPNTREKIKENHTHQDVSNHQQNNIQQTSMNTSNFQYGIQPTQYNSIPTEHNTQRNINYLDYIFTNTYGQGYKMADHRLSSPPYCNKYLVPNHFTNSPYVNQQQLIPSSDIQQCCPDMCTNSSQPIFVTNLPNYSSPPLLYSSPQIQSTPSKQNMHQQSHVIHFPSAVGQ